MLLHLLVENYILIEKVSVEFHDGFSVFTGETGAGKSLLIESLNFVSGARSSASVVAEYGEEALVQAVFDISNHARVITFLQEQGLYEEDNLIMTRSMNRQGRSTMRINGYHSTLATAKACMALILDIHSQHETQYLLSRKNHRYLLDQFLNDPSILNAYQERYRFYEKKLKERTALMEKVLDPEKIAFTRFVLNEIEQLNPDIEEFEALESRLKFLENYEKNQRLYLEIEQGLEQAQNLLYESQNLLEKLDEADKLQTFNNIYFELESFVEVFNSLNNTEEFDEYEFNQLNERMLAYQRAFRKYGPLEVLIEKQAALQKELDELENHERYLEDLEHEIEQAHQQARVQAEHLRVARKMASTTLEKRIESELRDLLLAHAQFEIELIPKPLHLYGDCEVVFKVSMNPGKAPDVIDQVASGGELSRLMLGLKVIFTKAMGIQTVIFDEIDSGLSGSAGFAIGSKMKSLAQDTQVLAITHLPSVAACAKTHYEIKKVVQGQNSKTEIAALETPERIEQLATMIDGHAAPAAREAAEALFSKGQG